MVGLNVECFLRRENNGDWSFWVRYELWALISVAQISTSSKSFDDISSSYFVDFMIIFFTKQNGDNLCRDKSVCGFRVLWILGDRGL